MKTVDEVIENIKFPELTDYFDQPIKPGDILVFNQDELYVVTNYINLNTFNPHITLIYLDTKQYYDYIVFKEPIISKFQKYNFININKIVPEKIKNIANIYFNLSKNKTKKQLKEIKTKDIFYII